MTTNYVGRNLRYLREQRNLTQEELAPKVFVSRSLYAEYETGDKTPNIFVLKRLCEFYEFHDMYALVSKDIAA